MAQKIKAVIIKPNHIPEPIYIDNDLMALNRAVNIDANGNPHSDFMPFEIVEIKDNINIISSPNGQDRSLPITRTIGRYSKFYGIIYIVKMQGLDLVSMDDREAIDYCIKFLDETVPLERLGLPSIDYGDDSDNNHDMPLSGRLEITCDDW